MKISFSRKGFDSAAGGSPSPIISGRPISLPIPTARRSSTTYRDIGLGEIVAHVTRNRVSDRNLCHFDPMFQDGHCAFGQTGAAQSHMAKHGFGDIFLFSICLPMRMVAIDITASSDICAFPVRSAAGEHRSRV